MKKRLAILSFPALVALAFLGGAGAATTPISGVVADRGCSAVEPITFSSPGTIQVLVGSSSVTGQAVAEILDSAGHLLSGTGSYDVAAGSYGVRVCSREDGVDQHFVQYSGLVLTGANGPALESTR